MRSLRQQWSRLGAALLFAIPALLTAAPVDGIFTYQQPDGSALKVRVRGDEFFAEETTLDGQQIVKDPDSQFWCYARLSEDGTDLESTGMVASDASPRAFATDALPVYFQIKVPQERRQRLDRLNRERLGRDARGGFLLPATPSMASAQTAAVPSLESVSSTTLGTKRGLTLLIRFSDRSADVTISRAQVENYCNQTSTHYTEFGNNGSVAEYFTDVSNGKLSYTNAVADYYTANNPRSYYTDESIGYGTRAVELIKEALNSLEASGFDFRTADGDGNGVIDALNCFYAGSTVNAWSKGLWPHASGLSWTSAKTGIRGSRYQISNMGSKLELGTFCHENGHMLCGFPDVYDYDGDSKGGSGAFDLMDAGCFGGNPCAPNGYMRYKAGWGSVEWLGQGVNATKSLTAEASGRLANQFVGYANPANTKEYFLLENFYKNDRNSGAPTGGVAVWHVDEQGDHNKQNYGHNTAHNNYEVALVQADNQRHFERNTNGGDAQDLFYAGNTAGGYINEFSDASDGGAYDNNAHWWSGANSGLKLSGFSSKGNVMSVIVQTPGSAFTITASSGSGGSISPSGAVSVASGGSSTFTIRASAGYVIQSVTVDGASVGAVGSYTFSNVSAAHTISATFAQIAGPAGYTWCAGENGTFALPTTCDVAFGANGSFNYLYGRTGTITFDNATFGDPISGVGKAGFYKITQYTLTASAGAGGTISPAGTVKVNHGGSQTYTLTPSAGYTVSALTVDGTHVGAPTSYTLSNVTSAHTIAATFAPIAGPAGYTWCAAENGSFTLPGTCDVAYGANGSFNYLYARTGTLTFNNATFGDPASGLAKSGFYRTARYTLTASAGTGGTITPSGAVQVIHGASQTFAIAPSAGYAVSAVTVDGTNVGAVTSHTFSSVTASHTIAATFIPATCSAAPAVPTGLAAPSTTSTSATLTWNAASAPAGCAVTYRVYSGTVQILTGLTSPSATLSNLTAGKTYSFSVAAVDAAGVSAKSTPLSVTTPATTTCSAAPAVPTGLASPSQTSSSVTLTWNPVSAPANCAVTYRVYSGTVQILSGLTSPSATISSLTAGKAYSFSVAAADAAGVSAKSTPLSVTPSTAATCSAAPAVPTGLSAPSKTATSVTLAWNAVSAPANCAVTYRVYSGTVQILSGLTSPGATISNLTAGRTYSFSVAAADAAGVSAMSAALAVTPQAAQFTLTASAGANGSISPSGAVTVAAGASQTFTLTPASGYVVGIVTVDGVAVGSPASYTFSNVSAAHTISATFAPSGAPAWTAGVHYANGALVTYEGQIWKNTYEHTSQADWFPGASGIWFWVLQ